MNIGLSFAVLAFFFLAASSVMADEPELSDAHQQALEELAQSWVNAKNMLEGGQEGDEDAGRYGTIYIENLRKAIAAASAAGLPESTPFEIGGFPQTTFGQVKKDFAQMTAQGRQNLDAVKAADAAKRAPFAKVLSGDKLRIFDEEFGVSIVNVGRNGKVLYTPAEYAAADLWARTGSRSDTVPPQWSVTIYRFNGTKLVSQERKTGFGSSAPSSAYQ
jgi:hypothetical protein